jgi:hypothetical protein
MDSSKEISTRRKTTYYGRMDKVDYPIQQCVFQHPCLKWYLIINPGISFKLCMFASAVTKLPLIFVYGQLRDTVIFRNRVKHEQRGTKLEHVRRSPVPTNLIFIKMADFRKIGAVSVARLKP